MTTVYLARHGETLFNVEGRLQGRSDSPLTERGERQARQLAERLDPVPLVAVYASSSARAVTTASLATQGRGLEVIPDVRLSEMSMGDWEGMPFPEIDRGWPELVAKYRNYDLSFSAPGGESWLEVQNRVRDAVADIVASHPEGDVLVVSHGVSIRLLLAWHGNGGISLPGLHRVRNCAVSILEGTALPLKLTLTACDQHLDPP